MFLNKIKAFVFQKGIGLKIVIPLSFLISLFLSFHFVQPFQEALKTQEVKETIDFITQSEKEIKIPPKQLKIEQINAHNYAPIMLSQALLTLKEKKVTHNLSKDQVYQLLEKALYLQSFLLCLVITVTCVLGFLFLYFSLTLIGPLFYNEIEKNTWGRILTLVWTPLLFVWIIGYFLHLNFGLIYFYAISILCSLLIGVYLKKNV